MANNESSLTKAVMVEGEAPLAVSTVPPWLEKLAQLDWKQIPPPVMAQILTQKPYRGKGALGPQGTRLSLAQALYLALRCYELGLSPLSGEVWFNAETWTTEVTVEGQKRLIANRGINVSPPLFESTTRTWPRNITPLAHYKEDIGITCRVEVLIAGKWFPTEYTAWLSDSFRPTPVWNNMPDHMLRVRALGRTLEMISGVGVSSAPSKELGSDEAVAAAMAAVPNFDE